MDILIYGYLWPIEIDGLPVWVYLGLAIKNGIKWVDLSMAMWLGGVPGSWPGWAAAGHRLPRADPRGAEELRPRRGDGVPTKEEVTWEIETHQIRSDNWPNGSKWITGHQITGHIEYWNIIFLFYQNSQVRYGRYGRCFFLDIDMSFSTGWVLSGDNICVMQRVTGPGLWKNMLRRHGTTKKFEWIGGRDSKSVTLW